MSFKPIQKLVIDRTLMSGELVTVGQLAQNRQGVYFQYSNDYLQQFGNLSPFILSDSSKLQLAPKTPHGGLHGVFADSLPDGWGLLLQDRVFRQQGIALAQITAMDRLAFVGSNAMGSLIFTPEYLYQEKVNDDIDIAHLGLQAQALFDGQTDEVLAALVTAGSSGGARPKAQIYLNESDHKTCRTVPKQGDEAWLVKFTSKNWSLGHEEGLCEAVYLQMANSLQLEPPKWQLLQAPASSGAPAWLALKRFDWVDNGIDKTAGRIHMHSACGLLDADFRMPSLDYEDLIKMSRHLCKSPAVGRLQFRRAMFNLFASNQDDHSKNWAFLQDDSGRWSPAPFYDTTYSPHPFNEHSTSFIGHGKRPPLPTIQKLAETAGFNRWQEAKLHIEEIVDITASFAELAKDIGVSKQTIKQVESTLSQRRIENSSLF